MSGQEQEIAALRARVAELEAQLPKANPRQRIEHMTAEVVDSNPYRYLHLVSSIHTMLY
jgi:hypothetical protein